MIGRIAASTLVSASMSLAGWRADALSGRGAIAATGVGSSLGAATSWRGLMLLGIFFVSSSALSRHQRGGDVAAKGSRRDERQVLANGGVAAFAALAASRSTPSVGLTLVGSSLAAATSDTWATELGRRSSHVPRLAISGRAVPRGTSGAVTRRGSLASLAGAAVIGVSAGAIATASGGIRRGLWVGSGVAVSGIAGSLADSLLGELLQERRHCPVCNVVTEAPVHTCGTATTLTGGVRGVDNDVVNLVCTAVGCVTSIPFARLGQ